MKFLFIPFALFLIQNACDPKHQKITCYDINGRAYFTKEDVEVTTSSIGFTLYPPNGSGISIGQVQGNCVVLPYNPSPEQK